MSIDAELRHVPDGWHWTRLWHRSSRRTEYQVRFNAGNSNRWVNGYGDSITVAIRDAVRKIHIFEGGGAK